MNRLIDVSNNAFPTPEEWAALGADTSLVGVICKATEGVSFLDRTLSQARADAARIHRPFGSYLFHHPNSDPVAQADTYLGYAKPRPRDIQPIVDTETTDGQNTLAIARGVYHCAQRLAEHGLDPILYGSQSWMAGLYSFYPGLKQFRLWHAEYGTTLHRIPGVRTVMWQFTDRMVVGRGRFDGSYLLARSIDDLLIPRTAVVKQPVKPAPAPVVPQVIPADVARKIAPVAAGEHPAPTPAAKPAKKPAVKPAAKAPKPPAKPAPAKTPAKPSPPVPKPPTK